MENYTDYLKRAVDTNGYYVFRYVDDLESFLDNTDNEYNGLYLNDCGIAYRNPQGIDKRLILSLKDTRRKKTKQIIKLLGKVEKLQEDILSINSLLSERGMPE